MVSFSAGLIRVFQRASAIVSFPSSCRRQGACPGGCVRPSMSVFTIGEIMTLWFARGIPCCVTSTSFAFPSPTDIDHIVAASDAHDFMRSA